MKPMPPLSQPPARRFHAVSLALLLPLALLGCSKPKDTASTSANPAVPVTLRLTKAMTVQRSIEIVGTLFGNEEAVLSAKVPGRIAAIRKDVGDVADAGQLLARIEAVDYELAIRQKTLAIQEQLAKLGLKQLPSGDFDATTVPTVRRAKLQADNAEARYNRARRLHEQTPPLLSDQDFADIRTAWDVAASNYDVELLAAKALLADAVARQADLDIATQRLRDTDICAPAASARYAVAARLVSAGEYVKEGAPLFKIVDDNPIKLRAAVPERHAGQVRVGHAVRVNVEAYAQDFQGEIRRINPQVDPANRTFQIEIIIPNEKHLLKSGAFARASILTHREDNVLFAPLDAIVSFAGTNKLYTIQDNKAVDIPLELGQRQGEWIEIKSTLKAGDPVVVRGQSKLIRGAAVTVKSTLADETQVPAETAP